MLEPARFVKEDRTPHRLRDRSNNIGIIRETMENPSFLHPRENGQNSESCSPFCPGLFCSQAQEVSPAANFLL